MAVLFSDAKVGIFLVIPNFKLLYFKIVYPQDVDNFIWWFEKIVLSLQTFFYRVKKSWGVTEYTSRPSPSRSP